MKWHVVFATPSGGYQQTVTLERGLLSTRANVLAAFRAAMHLVLETGGCRGFTVTVHPDGPDCDHEVGR